MSVELGYNVTCFLSKTYSETKAFNKPIKYNNRCSTNCEKGKCKISQ